MEDSLLGALVHLSCPLFLNKTIVGSAQGDSIHPIGIKVRSVVCLKSQFVMNQLIRPI